jgi:hypothetical protein
MTGFGSCRAALATRAWSGPPFLKILQGTLSKRHAEYAIAKTLAGYTISRDPAGYTILQHPAGYNVEP